MPFEGRQDLMKLLRCGEVDEEDLLECLKDDVRGRDPLEDKADHAAHQKDKDWWTPLHWAAQDGHERLAEKLLGLRVSTNAADACGATPLMVAAFNGRTRIIEALLKDRSTDVRQTNKYLTTALHYAAQRGHAASIELLVESKAEVNALDRHSDTPLSWAARSGHLDAEAIPAYCPPWSGYNFSEPYNSSSAPKVVRVVDPLAHVFLREVRQLPLPSGLLGDVVTVTCPSEFSRASGDTRFRCGHGLNGGQWQREVASVPQYNDNSTPDAILHLVDEATAEPLVCELETMKGVRRKYYDRLPGLFRNHSDSAGYDVVPYINQFQSPYDAAQFEAYLRPKLAGNYTLSIEVLGSFVLTWEKEILLAGRSQGLFPELFNTSELELSSDQFYFFHLEYWADPLLPERTDQEMITFPRRIRFLWSGPAGEMQPVPYTELYHSFDEVYGYPITLRGINDPAPCDSQNTVSITGLLEGDNGTIIDGSIGYNYNEDLTCDWMLEATGNVRFTIFANFFDVVGTTNCGGDRLEFYVAAGNALRLLGSVCGYHPEGTALVHAVSRSLVIRFVTDSATEAEGFNITWKVTDQAITLASDPVVSGRII